MHMDLLPKPRIMLLVKLIVDSTASSGQKGIMAEQGSAPKTFAGDRGAIGRVEHSCPKPSMSL